MKYNRPTAKLAQVELPGGFHYPGSFDEYLAQAISDADLEPWGFVAKSELSRELSGELGRPLIQFAQAWFEDMVACFVADGAEEPKVVVINPWADRLEKGEWVQVAQVLDEFPSFSAWLDWVRNSDLVEAYRGVRADHEYRTEGLNERDRSVAEVREAAPPGYLVRPGQK